MTFELLVTIIFTVMVLIGAVYLTYQYLKNSTLETIRKDVYQLFLKAEHMYKESGSGKQRLSWVVYQARKLLPKWTHGFITVSSLEKVINIWFSEIKDLLDDGKVNNSQK